MKKGFSLVEIIVVIAIIGILFAGSAAAYSKSVYNNKVDIAESDLRNINTYVKTYMIDYGTITIAPGADYETEVQAVVDILNERYFPTELTLAATAADKHSFVCETPELNDPWNKPYRINFYTSDGAGADSEEGTVVICSAGGNGEFNSAHYAEGNYDDDIIALIKPN